MSCAVCLCNLLLLTCCLCLTGTNILLREVLKSDMLLLQQLAPNLVKLLLINITGTIPGKTFCNLCSLTALTSLTLASRTGGWPVLQKGITHSISRLVNLRHLALFLGYHSDRWRLQLAPEISQLSALTSVILSKEGKCLGQTSSIVSMQEISMSHCQDVLFTAGLSTLTALTKFFSWQCHFSGQAADIRYLRSLKELMVIENGQSKMTAMQLSSLQEGISTLHNMTCLCISLPSKLPMDSAALQPLSNLQMLSLSIGLRHFTCQPSWTSLRELWLDGNSLTCPPANLNVLTALECLNMDDQDSENFQIHDPMALDIVRTAPQLKVLSFRMTSRQHVWSHTSRYHLQEAEQWLANQDCKLGCCIKFL